MKTAVPKWKYSKTCNCFTFSLSFLILLLHSFPPILFCSCLSFVMFHLLALDSVVLKSLYSLSPPSLFLFLFVYLIVLPFLLGVLLVTTSVSCLCPSPLVDLFSELICICKQYLKNSNLWSCFSSFWCLFPYGLDFFLNVIPWTKFFFRNSTWGGLC